MARACRPRGANTYGSKWITPKRRLAIYLRDGFLCAYCLRDLTGADRHGVTLDHLDGVHAPGHHGERNLVAACRSCNSRRQGRRWREFARAECPAGADQIIRRVARLRRRSLRRHLDIAEAIIEGECSVAEAGGLR